MTYYRICPDCGCSLDPQEICDCSRADTEKTAPDATNIQSGRVNLIDQTMFTSILRKESR